MEPTTAAALGGRRLAALAVRSLALCCALGRVQACRERAAPEVEASRTLVVQPIGGVE